MDSPKKYLFWPDVEQLTIKLAKLIQAGGVRYNVYLGIARGGLYPALMLSQYFVKDDHFDEINILSAYLRRYKGKQVSSSSSPRIISFPKGEEFTDKNVLVIDEVWQDGHSIVRAGQEVEKYNPLRIDRAVLHFKEGENKYPLLRPTYFVETTSDWIVYPWEMFAEAVERPTE